MSDLVEMLREAFVRGEPPTEAPTRPRGAQPLLNAIWRFLHAWHRDQSLGPDHAVLLRQIARWSPGLHVGAIPLALEQHRLSAGISHAALGGLFAEPFLPRWLRASGVFPDAGIDAAPVVRRPVETTPAEPYLVALGLPHWQSTAQKEAAWLALEAPPRSTTLVALPTGAGKSLCFQLLPKFGSGLTLVIVPTVALALDQWRSARDLFRGTPGVNPHYFAADDGAEATLSAVRERTTRLVFAAPEACTSGRLRSAIENAASEGWLENLVIDEAHLIETWGIYFRVDFQMLSVLRRRWLARTDSGLRTFLFSATFTPACRAVLQGLYWDKDESYGELICQRLRPEMTYYVAPFQDDPERRRAVIECAWRLPRPAIIYTTERADAIFLANTVRAEGFVRVECFHGGTSPRDRRRILERWRADELDVVIATSAFGLGVDKADVRAVVHACRPEDLHRYYQEVGRGGRDGYSTLCLLLPAPGDEDVARTIAPKLMRPDTIQRRWEALWQSEVPVEPERYIHKLCMEAKGKDLIGARTFDEHVRWNKRLVLQLFRAGQLDLEDLSYESREDGDGDPVEWVTVRLRFSPTVDRVGELVRAQRAHELQVIEEGSKRMERCIKGTSCIGRLLRDAYGPDLTQYVCGGCPACRRQGRQDVDCPSLAVPQRVVTEPAIGIIAQAPDARRPEDLGEWIRMFRMLCTKGVRRFACEGRHRAAVLAACGEADPSGRRRYRIDAVDEAPAFLIAPGDVLVAFHLDEVSASALALRSGRQLFHVLSKGIRGSLDVEGRYPLESAGASIRHYGSWDLVH